MSKITKPLNPLIYSTARDMACIWFEAALSSGLTDPQNRYNKNPRIFAVNNLEKFIPIAVKTLISMLKPTSNCTKEMREEIHAALTDPENDKELMTGKKNGLPSLDMEKIIRAYGKQGITTPVQTTVLHNPPEKPKLDLKGTAAKL